MLCKSVMHFLIFASGLFTLLDMSFLLQRSLGYYLIQLYLPCIFLVMLSWLVFWMSPESGGDRLTVGITCILTIVFLLGYVNGMLPKVLTSFFDCFQFLLSSFACEQALHLIWRAKRAPGTLPRTRVSFRVLLSRDFPRLPQMENLLTGYILFDGDFVTMWLKVHISRNHFFSVRVRSARPFFATFNQVGFFPVILSWRLRRSYDWGCFRQSLKEKL